jgi:amino acid transporter
MAEAYVEERELLRSMRWWDGFVVALANPGFLIAALGGSVAGLGTAGALLLWTISVCLGFFQNLVYAELALMFKDKSGGIALFAHEAWRKYFSLVGPIATFGYWFAWSSVLAINGLVVGTLIQAKWFASTTWSTHGAHFTFDLAVFIGIGVIIAVWVFNILGMRPAVWFSWLTGGLLMIPLVVAMFVPYFTGDFHGSNLTFLFPGGSASVLLAITWLYLMGWSSYGFECVATFGPEYHDQERDVAMGLRTAAMFSVLVYALFPLAVGGVLGTKAIAGDATFIAFYVTFFNQVVGSGLAGVMIALIVAGLVLSMNTATMDGSRALYGIARDGMTIRELGVLSRRHVPARAMTVDMVLNIWLLTFFAGALPIIAAGNLGYMLSHVLALSGFLLLRRDRPNWPRPVRLGRAMVPIVWFLLACNFAFIVIGGFVEADKYGYGLSKTFYGVGVLLISVLLYIFRRVVQDREPLHLREQTPTMPEEMTVEPASAPASV